MFSLARLLAAEGKALAVADAILGNVILGFGILHIVGHNLFSTIFIPLGIAALVPSYCFFRSSGEKIGVGFLNPVPMFLASAHERHTH